MNTSITITLNGSVAPNRRFQLGYKYENIGDTLEFTIPTKYRNYFHYLAFRLQDDNENEEQETFLLPINLVDGHLLFTISTAITKSAGIYTMIFLSTESEVVDGDIVRANEVFVSSEFSGEVIDNFLTDPINDEVLDPNLQIIYDDLVALRADLTAKIANDYYRGDYYFPHVDDMGVISWTIQDGKASILPATQNITGPQGPIGGYYTPIVNNNILNWSPSQEDLPEIASFDLTPMMAEVADAYLDEYLPEEVTKQIQATFQFEWDPTTETFYIYTKDGETDNIPSDLEKSLLDTVRAYIDAQYKNSITSLDERVTALEQQIASLTSGE